MGIPESLHSSLVREWKALGPAWDAKYPHDWLVWEPGVWQVPAPGKAMGVTRFMTTEAVGRPQTVDSRCFELVAPSGKLRIGRAPENDIVINDETVSREHLMLERVGARWLASALPTSKATRFTVKGSPAAEDAPVPLTSGDHVTLGGVVLTYLSAAALKERIRAGADPSARF